MKKLLALLIALSMVLTMTACGGSENPTPTEEKQPEQQEEILNREDDSDMPLDREDDSEETVQPAGEVANITDVEDFMNIIWSEQDEETKQQMIDAAAMDDTKITFEVDGTMRVEEADGTVTIQKPDGTWVVEGGEGEDISIGGGWPNNEFTKLLPEPDFEVNATSTDDTTFVVNFTNATVDDMKAYAQKVKAKGFDKDIQEEDMAMGDMVVYTYNANNGNGYTVTVSYAMGVTGVNVTKE